MMAEKTVVKDMPLTQYFIRTFHKTLLREDNTVYRELQGGVQTSYVIYAGQNKTRPYCVITRYGGWFEYASPEEHPSLMTDLVDWYNAADKNEYLEALHQTDLEVGTMPADGAHADIKNINPFLKYYNELVATEVYNDVLFVSERDENVWWYDGEWIATRTPYYTKILTATRTLPTLTLADMKDNTGISITAIQMLLDQLIEKKYVKRREEDGSWRVFLTQ